MVNTSELKRQKLGHNLVLYMSYTHEKHLTSKPPLSFSLISSGLSTCRRIVRTIFMISSSSYDVANLTTICNCFNMSPHVLTQYSVAVDTKINLNLSYNKCCSRYFKWIESIKLYVYKLNCFNSLPQGRIGNSHVCLGTDIAYAATWKGLKQLVSGIALVKSFFSKICAVGMQHTYKSGSSKWAWRIKK